MKLFAENQKLLRRIPPKGLNSKNISVTHTIRYIYVPFHLQWPVDGAAEDFRLEEEEADKCPSYFSFIELALFLFHIPSDCAPSPRLFSSLPMPWPPFPLLSEPSLPSNSPFMPPNARRRHRMRVSATRQVQRHKGRMRAATCISLVGIEFNSIFINCVWSQTQSTLYRAYYAPSSSSSWTSTIWTQVRLWTVLMDREEQCRWWWWSNHIQGVSKRKPKEYIE